MFGHVIPFWQLSIHHNMNVQYERCMPGGMPGFTCMGAMLCDVECRACSGHESCGQPSYQGPLRVLWGWERKGPQPRGCRAASHDGYAYGASLLCSPPPPPPELCHKVIVVAYESSEKQLLSMTVCTIIDTNLKSHITINQWHRHQDKFTGYFLFLCQGR